MERVAVVTGASSGIGLETARALVGQGFRLIGIGRDPERCRRAQSELSDAVADSDVAVLRADLSRMAEVEQVAEEIAKRTDRIDVLVNNAGGMGNRLVVTSEGLDENFAANHLGPFLLTERLLPLLRRATHDAPAGSVRIVMTSSDASEYVPELPWEDLQMLGGYDPGRAYCHGKLANVMFARGLASRFGGEGIVALSVHPGPVDTNFASYTPESVQAHMKTLDLLTPEQGADSVIWAVTSSEAGRENGRYVFERSIRKPNPLVEDEASVDRLWAESERLVAAALSG